MVYQAEMCGEYEIWVDVNGEERAMRNMLSVSGVVSECLWHRRLADVGSAAFPVFRKRGCGVGTYDAAGHPCR